MRSDIYQRRSDLRVDIQPDGWARISWPSDETGVALDPKLFAVWWAAASCTPQEVARKVRISTYAASSALAALAHGGLLECRATPARVNQPSPPKVSSPVSVLIVQCHRQAGVEASVRSVLDQGYPALTEISVLAQSATRYPEEGVGIVPFESAASAESLVRRASEAGGEALLLLDSRVSLAPGALSEMIYTLGLRSDIAGVAPRIMWNRWPAFVVGVGSRGEEQAPTSGYWAGCLDVGQFPRWCEVLALSGWAGLMSCEALQRADLFEIDDVATWMAKWCRDVRLAGDHLLAATEALAYGPWPEVSGGPGKKRHEAEAAESHIEPPALIERPWPGSGDCADLEDRVLLETDSVLHHGRAALTVEAVRGLYDHYPAISPLPIRRRILFLGKETPRRWGIRRQLSTVADVSWIAPGEADDQRLQDLCQGTDMLIVGAESVQRCGSLEKIGCPVLVDVQPPMTPSSHTEIAQSRPLHEQVEAFADRSDDWLEGVDGVICASEEERLYWLGQLAGRGRINPYTAQAHYILRHLVMVVPSGVDPVGTSADSAIRETLPDAEAEDRIVLWPGAVRAFDDPHTVIRAVSRLLSSHDHLKLIFVAFEGDEHEEHVLQSAIDLAAELGVTESLRFDHRIPRSLRDSYLAGADVAVSLGGDSLEAQLHEPLGLPECIRSGLPMVVTDRHAGSCLIQRYDLGQTVPVQDTEAVVDSIEACLERPRETYSEGFAEARQVLAWDEVVTPLVDFCQQPHYALDRLVGELLFPEGAALGSQPTPVRALPVKAWRLYQEQGLGGAIREIRQYIRWRIGA